MSPLPLLLRRHFDPAPLAEELDRALRNSSLRDANLDGTPITFRYVPMMCEHTPVSLALLDRFAGMAAELLGAPVLPVRAKGVEYRSAANWHRDSTRVTRSLGFLAYLDPLRAETGALRVISEGKEEILETDPGDVIVLDEHLLHGSVQREPAPRRQWRVDFVADGDPDLGDYFRDIFAYPATYDAARFPSYGPHWQGSGRPAVERLRALGVYEMAERSERGQRAYPSLS